MQFFIDFRNLCGLRRFQFVPCIVCQCFRYAHPPSPPPRKSKLRVYMNFKFSSVCWVWHFCAVAVTRYRIRVVLEDINSNTNRPVVSNTHVLANATINKILRNKIVSSNKSDGVILCDNQIWRILCTIKLVLVVFTVLQSWWPICVCLK